MMTAEEIYGQVQKNQQKLLKLGISENHQEQYGEAINNGYDWDRAFEAATEGLSLSAGDRAFAADFLSDMHPNLYDPNEY
jgi:hypothetical protein